VGSIGLHYFTFTSDSLGEVNEMKSFLIFLIAFVVTIVLLEHSSLNMKIETIKSKQECQDLERKSDIKMFLNEGELQTISNCKALGFWGHK
jgi:cell division protein FtsL